MGYIYGPVVSRRLGMSLGIDVVPLKTCSFDCIYCQLASSSKKITKRKEYVSAERILDEFREFSSKNRVYEWITFSGSGEPTLNIALGDMIREIKKISSKKVCVITNSSFFKMEEARHDLLEADLVMPSLDAVSQHIFERINRPFEGVTAEEIIEGLAKFRMEFFNRIWLEIMLVKGINDTDREVEKFAYAIKRIKPDKIHLNTVVRPPVETDVLPVDRFTLIKIADKLGKNVNVIGNLPEIPELGSGEISREGLLSLLESHPATLDEISASFGVSVQDAKRIVEELIKIRGIRVKHFENKQYYIFNS